MMPLLVLARLALADGGSAEPAPASEADPPVIVPADPPVVAPPPPVAPPPTYRAPAPDNALIRTGLYMSKSARIGGMVGVGMLVAGTLVRATDPNGQMGEVGAGIQTAGLGVTLTAAPAYVGGPLVTAQGIRNAGAEVEMWPGWTGVGLLAVGGALTLLAPHYQDEQALLSIGGFGGLIAGGVMIDLQSSKNRRALVIGPPRPPPPAAVP